ncbi:MAG: hypothetical protein MJZ16_13235 [Bacteroidales bacterium]|nr:hypothetical protein [Bacteroidales bacterium]
MNNTKWNEIFQSFYKNECEEASPIIRWRTKDIETHYLTQWDGTWTHFGCEPRAWDKIDYLQIELTADNGDFVINTLKKIHVLGDVNDDVVTVYGYRQDVDYI